MREIVERTLPKTAAACDAWIFSSGVNGGCPKMLGSGTRTYGLALNAIGVTGWAAIDPRVRILILRKLLFSHAPLPSDSGPIDSKDADNGSWTRVFLPQ